MARPHDRPASYPGGCECLKCGVIFVGEEWHDECACCAAFRVVEDAVREIRNKVTRSHPPQERGHG
jgi:hypothetical protein